MNPNAERLRRALELVEQAQAELAKVELMAGWQSSIWISTETALRDALGHLQTLENVWQEGPGPEPNLQAGDMRTAPLWLQALEGSTSALRAMEGLRGPQDGFDDSNIREVSHQLAHLLRRISRMAVNYGVHPQAVGKVTSMTEQELARAVSTDGAP
jgi:hypothetical protein